MGAKRQEQRVQKAAQEALNKQAKKAKVERQAYEVEHNKKMAAEAQEKLEKEVAARKQEEKVIAKERKKEELTTEARREEKGKAKVAEAAHNLQVEKLKAKATI